MTLIDTIIFRVYHVIYYVFAVQVLCLEKSLEEMLTRVDEFVGMLDMVRSIFFFDVNYRSHENVSIQHVTTKQFC